MSAKASKKEEDETEEEKPADGDSPEGEISMTIWEHLAELRTRLMRAALALLAGAIIAWVYREKG